MRVFVTGASGFIGAHVTRKLVSMGHEVAILIRPGKPLIRLKPLPTEIKVIHATLEDTDLLEQAVKEFHPEACIHLAWYVEPGKYINSEKNLQSLMASLSLFRVLVKAGCRQIVAAGTCVEYDTDFGYLHEDTPARPANLYAAAKLSCHLLGQQLAMEAGVNFAWGRVFYAYGPGEDERRLVTASIMALKQGNTFPATQGEQVRDYIHVEDVAEAFCVLMERRADGVFNISSGMPVSIRQLLETVGDLLGRRDLIQFGKKEYCEWEPPFICGNNHRLRELMWSPKYTLYNGLLHTIQEMNKG